MSDTPYDPDAPPVVLINVFKCDPARQHVLMERVGDLLRVQRDLPGFLSATLHRGLNGRTVASHVRWRSAVDWKVMARSPQVSAAMNPILSLATFEPNLYEAGLVVE